MKTWIAQGFGVGRIPVAPGTFGSLQGLAWFALLLCGRSWTVFLIGAAAGLFLSVYLCEKAEASLGQRDPGSVVMDEITAMPLCFAGWMAAVSLRQETWPGPGILFSARNGLATLAVFGLFRLFDVIKPWPVRQSQVLHGGWGITVDDVLAAGYVNLVVWAWRLAAIH